MNESSDAEDGQATLHTEQSIPHDWIAIQIGNETVIVYQNQNGPVRAYTVSKTSRNVRTLAQADAVLYEGNVCETHFDGDTRTLEFIHSWGGQMGRASVAEWLDEPAVCLTGQPRTEVLPVDA